MNIFKSYAFTICLIAGILTGGIFGVIFGEGASVVKPIGDAFLNLMFVLIVPLVFFSISSAIYNMKQMNMVGKVLTNIVVVFIGMSLIAAIAAYLLTFFYNPLQGVDKTLLMNNLPQQNDTAHLSPGALFVRTFTVPDFLQLFTKSNLLPLIFFSIFLGLATAYSGERGKSFANFLNSGTAIITILR